jgi:signal transduction histidine kinase
LLLLMAAIATDSWRSLREVETTSTSLRRESRTRDALLDQLRLDIGHSATVVRDHLLEPDDIRAASHKAELEMIHIRVDQTLARYADVVAERERGTFRKLQDDVTAYWQSLTPALQWDAVTRRLLGVDYLNRVVRPRRSQAVELISQTTILNERDLDSGEERIRAVQSGVRNRVTIVSIVCVLLGSILAAFSVRRIRRLERQGDTRYQEVEDARRELSRLSAQLVRAQEEERRRLSRELHDEIGQSMSAMLFELRRLEAVPPDPETQRKRFASVCRLAENTVSMVRNMALLLRPSMLDDLGLVAALRWQAKEVSRRMGLNVRVVADEIREDPPEPLRTCLYRVVQEALHNCAKHSKAGLVRVIVSHEADSLCLYIQDDGIGFNPRVEKGLGLLGMEERVENLGGRFSIESRPGAGTTVSTRFRNVETPTEPIAPEPIANGRIKEIA